MKRLFVRSLLSVIAWMVVCPMNAQRVSKEAALLKAQAFLSNNTDGDQSTRRTPRHAPRLVLANDATELYIFNDEANGGYVIVSGDERMPDVLGYSYDDQYVEGDVPCNMQSILDGYATQVRYLRQHPEAKASIRRAAERAPIEPLISCKWNQFEPFNNKCPEVNGEHCATGCVATAMAQIMYYHRWPKQTSEVIPSYTTSTNKIKMPEIPVTTIDWDNMVDIYRGWGEETPANEDAVATLMLLCGSSARVDYDPSGSASIDSRALEAFPKYFDYDDALSLLYRDWFDEEEWEQMIYDELHDGRPVFYSGSGVGEGHAYLVDGYDKDGFYHMNFGWGHTHASSGYYLFTGPLEGYNRNQMAIVNIKPASSDSPKAYGVLDNGKLTFYYDKKKDSRSGKIIPHLRYFPKDNLESYTACEFDASFKDFKIYDFWGFFSSSKYLKSIEGLANLNTSNAVTMCQMFMGCTSLNSLDLSHFNTSKVTDMSSMFEACSSLKELDLSSFDTKRVTDMSAMFDRCKSLESLNVSSFDTKNVYNMTNMFSACGALKRLNLSHFITDNVTDMSGMFNGLCTTSLDISHFNTSNVTDMSYMFSQFYAPIDLDLSHFNTENVTRMEEMFYNTHISSINVSHFNTSKVTNMSQMFSACFDIKELDLRSFDTSRVTDMTEMFRECGSLRSVDLSSFDTKNVTKMREMFALCSSLKTIYVSELWDMSNVSPNTGMFDRCNALEGSKGTTYMNTMSDANHSGSGYAHIDGGPDNPGYFTYKKFTEIQPINAKGVVFPSVFSLSGTKVRAEGMGTKGLPAGIYIVGGKKMVVR